MPTYLFHSNLCCYDRTPETRTGIYFLQVWRLRKPKFKGPAFEEGILAKSPHQARQEHTHERRKRKGGGQTHPFIRNPLARAGGRREPTHQGPTHARRARTHPSISNSLARGGRHERTHRRRRRRRPGIHPSLRNPLPRGGERGREPTLPSGTRWRGVGERRRRRRAQIHLFIRNASRDNPRAPTITLALPR